MILFPLNENTPAAPNDPAGRHRCVAPRASAASSTSGTPVLLAQGDEPPVVGRSARTGRPSPPPWAGARAGPGPQLLGDEVRVDLPRRRRRSRRAPAGRRCRWPRWRVATKVNVGTSTSSPGPTPDEQQRQVQRGGAARQRHGVGHARRGGARSSSKASTWGPSGAIQPESSASRSELAAPRRRRRAATGRRGSCRQPRARATAPRTRQPTDHDRDAATTTSGAPARPACVAFDAPTAATASTASAPM